VGARNLFRSGSAADWSPRSDRSVACRGARNLFRHSPIARRCLPGGLKSALQWPQRVERGIYSAMTSQGRAISTLILQAIALSLPRMPEPSQQPADPTLFASKTTVAVNDAPSGTDSAPPQPRPAAAAGAD